MADVSAETQDWIAHWDCYPSPNIWWKQSYIISIVCATFNVLMFILNFYQLTSKHKSLDIYLRKTTYKLFYFLILLLYSLGPIAIIFTFTIQNKCVVGGPKQKGRLWWLYGMLFSVQTMTFAGQFLYLFYVLRIKLLFDKFSSVLAFKRPVTLFLIIGFLLQIIFQSLSTYYYHVTFTIDFKFRYDALDYGYVALGINIVCTIILLAIFVRKIYQLINMDVYEMSRQKQKHVILFAVRYLWLVCVALMSTNLVNIINVYSSQTSHSVSVVMIKNTLVLIDATNNVFCLYLQFKFADTIYFKLCKVCQAQCLKCFRVANIKYEQKGTETKYQRTDLITINRQTDGKEAIAENKRNASSIHQGDTQMGVCSMVETENLMAKIDLDKVKLPTIICSEKKMKIDTSTKNTSTNETTVTTTDGMDVSTRLYLVQ